MTIESEEDAKIVVGELAAEWEARSCFFMGAFDRESDEFVAQIYVGPVDWTVPNSRSVSLQTKNMKARDMLQKQ